MSTPTKKKIGAVDFFCLGFGAIVGVGWAVSINSWMINCGGPVPAAIGYLLCLIMMVPIALCYCELVPMMPVAGGGMAFSYKAFNSKVSFASGWAAYGAFVAIIPWEAIQITDVLCYLFPALKAGKPLYSVMGSDIYLTTIVIGVLCSILLFSVNMRGLSSAASLHTVSGSSSSVSCPPPGIMYHTPSLSSRRTAAIFPSRIINAFAELRMGRSISNQNCTVTPSLEDLNAASITLKVRITSHGLTISSSVPSRTPAMFL